MISIFTRPSFVGNRYPDHTDESTLLRVSARIRGEEIAEYTGAKLNPTDGYENDVCIYVKPKSLDHVRDGDYLDYLDSKNMIYLLKDRPKIKVIASCLSSYLWLKENLDNEIVLIPTHHINFERSIHRLQKRFTAGYIGGSSPHAFDIYKHIGRRLNEVGITFKSCFNFKTRLDAVNLYNDVDLFIVGPISKDDTPNKIPTKLINAMSFGIPSIAYPLKGYKEIDCFYTEALTVDEIITEAVKFKMTGYYINKVIGLTEFAEKYHISNIAKLYKLLI